MEEELLQAYRDIFRKKAGEPAWAVHKNTQGHEEELIHCPIPFVGRKYGAGGVRLLVYGSAENLSDYHTAGKTYLDDDSFAIRRHRACFEETRERFYPQVNLQPISDGGLALAAFYLYRRPAEAEGLAPAEFLERIAFANYCKYTIEIRGGAGKRQNVDYAGRAAYLRESHLYLERELAILQPDVILLPRSICEADRAFLEAVRGGALLAPIYQINARTVNLRIRRWPRAAREEVGETVWRWWERLDAPGLRGKTKENFLSVFRYLDETARDCGLDSAARK